MAKNVDMARTIGRLIGILIFGFFDFFDLAFFAIRSMRIPVVPLEIAPPIPRIEVKVAIWKCSIRM